MLIDTGKSRKTCVEVAGRRTFRVLAGPSDDDDDDDDNNNNNNNSRQGLCVNNSVRPGLIL